MFYESDTIKSKHKYIFWAIDISLILFNSSWVIYLIPKESKYAVICLSINNKT